MKKIPFAAFILFMPFLTFSQDKKLSKKEEKELLNMISNQLTDPKQLINNAGKDACKCLDSLAGISRINSETESIKVSIQNCIKKEAISYQLISQLNSAVLNQSKKKENTIYFDVEGNSKESKKFYMDIENWLIDSCASLKELMKGNTEPSSDKSYGTKENAIKYYNSGTDKLREKKYDDALVYFNMVVLIDPEFAFAWDNIGVCHRNLNQFDKALNAYKKSMAIDPKGITPIQNSAFIYMTQKKYKEAIECYQKIADINPEDPESFYGLGNAYREIEGKEEDALKNMCKAYRLYSEQKSPYRVDAQSVISLLYQVYKKNSNLDRFNAILKENNINEGEK
jgi:tetratricopeptide (TPR) repeat protein